MTHGEAAHERGTHNMFTGYRPSPALSFPSMGSVVSHEYGPRNNLPPYVCIPNVPNEFAGTGYLSSSFAPFSLGADPANNGFKVRDLNLPGGVDDARFTRRRTALDAVNDHFAKKEKSDNDQGDEHLLRAGLQPDQLASRLAKRSTSTPEPAALRDEYGRNEAGQRMLMARRLVGAGVRFVSLTYGGWDMHTGITSGMQGQMPPFDQAFAALISDLDRTGLLDDHAGHGLQRIRPHAEDQRHRRPRSLAEGVQRRARRRRHQEGHDLRHLERHGLASRNSTPSARRIWPPRSTTSSASSPTRN